MSTMLGSEFSRRSFIKGAGATAATALLAAMGISATDATFAFAGDGGKTFTYAIAGDPSVSPNVITTGDRFGLMTLKLVYSPLWMYNADGINYFLADSYDTSDDGKTLTVHLHEGVKWQDGEPFTADDVVFTYEAIESTETANQYSQLVYDQGKVEVKKVDDLTVTFTFPIAIANAAEMISQGFIMPKHLYEGVTDWEHNDVNNTPVGTGPYQLMEYQPGQYLRFEANKDYFLGAPHIDQVVFQIVTNENTGMQAIQAGEVNAWIGTPAEVQQMNIQGNGLTVTPYSEGRVAYLAINCNRVTDENVRKAILYSFDKPAICNAALLDPQYYDVEYTFLPTISEFYDADAVEKYDRDVEKAKQLLADAGQANPTFTIAYDSGNTLTETDALMMKEQAAEAGITLNIQAVDPTALSNTMLDDGGDYDMYFGGYIMGIDPTTFAPLFESDANWNYMHWGDAYPEIDELFAQGASELDPDKRKKIFSDLQAAVQNTGAFYPLYSNKRLLVTTSNVTNIQEAGLVPVYTFEDLSKLDMQ
ncbi:ABC transporter substrate-binding protein [bacterium]|nr:ABC transporter substrate-binding protein [bacterium]